MNKALTKNQPVYTPCLYRRYTSRFVKNAHTANIRVPAILLASGRFVVYHVRTGDACNSAVRFVVFAQATFQKKATLWRNSTAKAPVKAKYRQDTW
jgi:hypothetical protein